MKYYGNERGLEMIYLKDCMERCDEIEKPWPTRRPEPTDEPRACCKAMTAECMACAAGVTIREICSRRQLPGCGKFLVTELFLLILSFFEKK